MFLCPDHGFFKPGLIYSGALPAVVFHINTCMDIVTKSNENITGRSRNLLPVYFKCIFGLLSANLFYNVEELLSDL